MNKQAFIRFGHYLFGADGKQAEIEWLILDEQLTPNGKEVLLYSRYILDAKQFDEALFSQGYVPSPSNCWATSSLRCWLNRSFFHLAFNEAEQNRILPTNTVAKDSLRSNSGWSTADKVFLLSVEETRRYPISLSAPVSPYAEEEALTDYYWLRTPVISYGGVACGGPCSDVLDPTIAVNRVCGYSPEMVQGVRPAIRVIL